MQADLVSQVAYSLRRDGLYSTLALLNGRTRFRYTGVYMFEPPLLRNVCMFDREDASVRAFADMPLTNSYCAIVAATGNSFATTDSLQDSRLIAHPARRRVIAFHGFPLRDTKGRCVGALCHWDLRTRSLDPREAMLHFDVTPFVAYEASKPRRPRKRWRLRGRDRAAGLSGFDRLLQSGERHFPVLGGMAARLIGGVSVLLQRHAR